MPSQNETDSGSVPVRSDYRDQKINSTLAGRGNRFSDRTLSIIVNSAPVPSMHRPPEHRFDMGPMMSAFVLNPDLAVLKRDELSKAVPVIDWSGQAGMPAISESRQKRKQNPHENWLTEFLVGDNAVERDLFQMTGLRLQLPNKYKPHESGQT